MIIEIIKPQIVQIGKERNTVLIKKEPHQAPNFTKVSKQCPRLKTKHVIIFANHSSEMPMKRFQECLFDINNFIYIALNALILLDLALNLIQTSRHKLNEKRLYIFNMLCKSDISLSYIETSVAVESFFHLFFYSWVQ
jgi:hypothetical protein